MTPTNHGRSFFMLNYLWVMLGGAVGSGARYALGGFIFHHAGQWRFPLSTFFVNVIGCFAIGALGGLGERYSFLTAEMRLLLITGFLGGFTTFSAFGVEGVNLIRRGDWSLAISYASLSVVCGFAAVCLGLRIFGLNFHRT